MLKHTTQQGEVRENSSMVQPSGQNGGALLGVMIGVVIVAIVFCAMWFFTGPAGGGGWGQLADLPADTWGCGTLSDPSPLVKTVEGVVGGLPYEIKTEIRDNITDELGLDVFSGEALERAGFDTTAPVVLNVPRQGISGEPQSVVFSVGVNDEKRALDTIEGMARRNNLDWHRDGASGQEIYSIEDEMTLFVRDQRLYMSMGETVTDALDALREMTDDTGKKLGDTEEFDKIRRSMNNANVVAYIQLQPIFRSIRSEMYYDEEKVVVDWLMDNFETLATTADEGRSETMVSFASRSTLAEKLNTAGSCRDFLSQLDEPMAALTVSIDKPVHLVFDIAEELGGRAAVSEMEREFESEFEMPRDDLEKLFEKLVGGVAIYGFGRYGDPQMMVFFQLSKSGEQAIKDFIHKVAPEMDSRACKNGELYRDRNDDEFLMGFLDGYFVIGNATNEIQDLADGRGDDWKPRCGGNALVTVEYRLDKFMDGARNLVPSEVIGIINSFIGNDKSQQWIYAELSADDNGILLRTESPFVGTLMNGNIAGVAAAVAVPSFLKARETSQTNACINNLRQISGAQDQMLLNGSPVLTRSGVNEYLMTPDPTCPAGGGRYDLTQDPPVCPNVREFPEHVLP